VGKLELVRFHINFASAKPHALGFKPKALFDGRVSPQFDFTAGAQHPLPRKSEAPVQHAGYLACRSGQSCRLRNGSVGRHFSLGDAANRPFNQQPRLRLLA